MLLSPRAASSLLSICGIVLASSVATGEGLLLPSLKGCSRARERAAPLKCLRLHIPCAPPRFAELLLILARET